jgi:hypothetical protein
MLNAKTKIAEDQRFGIPHSEFSIEVALAS